MVQAHQPGGAPAEDAPAAIAYSVVVPIWNEEENLPELCTRLLSVLRRLEEPFEVILVDDGSRDGSLEIIRDWHAEHPEFRCISFARHFGHQTAITAGIDLARGEAVIVMDGDLQDPPETIPEFVARWREGNEVVYAVREKRKENALKRLCYATFYRLLQRISYLDIPLDSGDFCLMDRRVVDVLGQMPERNRFVRGLRTWVGFRQTQVRYERQARAAGRPKYSFIAMAELAIRGLVSFSFVPLRVITSIGFLVSFGALVWGLYIIIWRLRVGAELPGYATIMVAILFIGGMQLTALGVLGEYIGQIYDEVKQRPRYVARELIGFAAPGKGAPTTGPERPGA